MPEHEPLATRSRPMNPDPKPERTMEHMHEKYPTAPAHLLDAIHRYATDHTKVDGFLTAVLENNLREAIGRSDQASQHGLLHIVQYCHWEIPHECWGSPAKVKAWLAQDNQDQGQVRLLDSEEAQACRDRAEAEEGGP